MSELKAGDSFPEGVKFQWVPPTPEKADIGSCGIPAQYDASKEFKNKKIALVGVPGAFTPTCTEKHVPSYIENWDKLKAKGVDHVVVIASNDHWVMSAWGKANGIKDDSILFMADDDQAFAKTIGWTMGPRVARFAMLIDHGKVVYAGKDEPKSTEASGAEAILSRL